MRPSPVGLRVHEAEPFLPNCRRRRRRAAWARVDFLTYVPYLRADFPPKAKNMVEFNKSTYFKIVDG